MKELNGYPCYNLPEFRANSDDHLAVILTRGWMKRNEYRVYSPFYLEDKHGNLYFFDIGFISDGGTIPIWLSPILRYNGKGMAAFLIHDLACQRANDSGMYVYRSIGDAELDNHLIECGVYKFIAKIADRVVTKYGLMLKAKGDLK